MNVHIRSTLFGAAASCALGIAWTPCLAGAQAPSPSVGAFRENGRNVAERIALAAEALPVDRYQIRWQPTDRTPSELLAQLAHWNDYACGQLAGTVIPERVTLPARPSKTEVLLRVKESFDGCDRSMRELQDGTLGDSIAFSMAEWVIGQRPRTTRGVAMLMVTSYWAEVYSLLATQLRSIGRTPPEVCHGLVSTAWNLNQLCDSGFNT